MDVFSMLAAHLDSSHKPHDKAQADRQWPYDADFRWPMIRLGAVGALVAVVMIGFCFTSNGPVTTLVAALTSGVSH